MREQELTANERAAYRRIRNALVHGLKPPTTRELTRLLGYRSPRTGAVLINRLIQRGLLYRTKDGVLRLAADLPPGDSCVETVDIPLVGTANCGGLLLAEENVETTYPISTKFVPPPFRYFLLRAKGDSMDRSGIRPGDLLLVKQVTIPREDDVVVALINDEATVKRFRRSGDDIVLWPDSTNPENKPIYVGDDLQIQGVVVKTFPGAPNWLSAGPRT